MDKRELGILNHLIHDMGFTVVSVGKRYFIGILEIPTETQRHCHLNGVDVSEFFGEKALVITVEALTLKVIEHMNKNPTINIKFNVNTEWFVYSKN